MATLKYLLEQHADLLQEPEKAAALEHVRRTEAAISYARPKDLTDLEAQSAFITFEREFCEQPVRLFGQDVPSLAHTILRVFRAKQGDAQHLMEPAEEIFSARVSEKGLTECMLSTNRGDEGAALTVMQLGDFSLPPRAKNQTAVAEAAEARQVDRAKHLQARVDTLRSQLGPDVTKPNAALREAVQGLWYNARDVMSGSYDVMRHMENMSQVRNQILTEAAHAALHADKVSEALKSTTALLPPPEPIDWVETAARHPMVNMMLNPVSAELREAIRIMVLAEMKKMATRHPKILDRIREEDGVEYIRIGSGQELSAILSYTAELNEDKAHAERMDNLWNMAFNPHIARDRPKYAADQAMMSLSQRHGDTRHIHSSLPPIEQSYFSVRINPAYVDNEFGDARIRSRHSPLIELEIVGQDLMTALRGHPKGRPVPCSIRHMCNVAVSRQVRPELPIATDIDEVDKRIQASPEAARVQAAIDEAIDIVNAKRSGKAWRKELDEALAEFEDAMGAITARAKVETDNGRNLVNMHTSELAREMLKEISDVLPEGTLKVLGLPGSE